MPDIEQVQATRVIDKADELETLVSDLSTTASMEQVATVRDRLTAYLERGKAIEKQLDAIMLAWIEATGKQVTIGPVRYYVATPTTVKCRSVPATMEALMQATGGDWDQVCECLGSNAIKYGAARKVLGERYDEFFVKEERKTLKREGPDADATPRQLMKVDERFLK